MSPIEAHARELLARLRRPSDASPLVRRTVGQYYQGQAIRRRTGRLQRGLRQRGPEGKVRVSRTEVTVWTLVPYAKFVLARHPIQPPPTRLVADTLAQWLLDGRPRRPRKRQPASGEGAL